MNFSSLKFGFLFTTLLVMASVLLVDGHFFLENLERYRITNSAGSSTSLVSYNYTQVVDHFAYTPESYQTFPQRYFVDNSNWGGAQNNSPIFVWFGGETDITFNLDMGIFIDQAPKFKALVVYIEHRYYGTSMPFGGKEEAYANASTKGYFTSTQALADYATFIVDLKKILKADNCPVVVFGASYGGMLTSWFRLKYPHLTIGAVASSAPILYFDNITPTYAYGSVVTKDFKNVSEICYRRINESWDMMDKMASTPQGLLNLSKLFNTCQNITNKDALHAFYNKLGLIYVSAAQYNFEEVKGICKAMNSLEGDADTISRIVAAVNYSQGTQCLDLSPPIFNYSGWFWQICTEMVFPISNPPGTTMFRPSTFDFDYYARDCYLKYGVYPRQHWITTEFGGHDIK